METKMKRNLESMFVEPGQDVDRYVEGNVRDREYTVDRTEYNIDDNEKKKRIEKLLKYHTKMREELEALVRVLKEIGKEYEGLEKGDEGLVKIAREAEEAYGGFALIVGAVEKMYDKLKVMFGGKKQNKDKKI